MNIDRDDSQACEILTRQIERLIREPIRLEAHEEVPGEWGVWCGDDHDSVELVGAGMSRRAALENALQTANGWAK
jgi:hypothetical protein